jgi:hypothetical protein
LQVTKPIYQWKTESSNDKDGFNHCLVKNMYDNGTMMILAENREHITRLALHFPQDKMQPNQQFDLTIQVDKRDVFPGRSSGRQPTSPDHRHSRHAARPDETRQCALFARPQGRSDLHAGRHERRGRSPTRLRHDKSGRTGHREAGENSKRSSSEAVARNNKLPDDLLDAPPPEMKANPYDVTEYDETAAQTEKKNPITAFVDKLKGSDDKDKREIKVAERSSSEAIAQTENAAPAKKEMVETAKPKPAPVMPAPKPIEPPKAEKNMAVKPEPKKLVEKKEEKKPVEPKQDEQVKPAPLLPAPYGDVMNVVNLEPETLLMGMQGQKGNKPLDYAWLKGDLFVGIKKQGALPNPSVRLPQFMTGYMQMLKAHCAGEFVAEASSYTTTPQGGYIIVEAACAPQQGEDTIAALLFIADATQASVYFVEAPGAHGANAIKARNAILNAAAK